MSKEKDTPIQLRLPSNINNELDKYLTAYKEIRGFKSKQNLCIDILEKHLPYLTSERIRLERVIKELD